ncbi:hypothetical protein, partial [Haliscomenobacter sp.]|uniref:hypothetical protein n=1 Tax=Haliscomenobacter sp. TaxID=2717303 RepID=UPI003364B7B5
MKQIAPDHDENRYYYDRVGRLVASQDGRQRPSNKYSYTLYDALGRVTQTGEGVNASVPATIFADAPAFNTWFGTLTSKAHVTRTYYDLNPITNTQLPITYPRDNQRSRVAASTIVATFNASDDVYDYATHYSYDLTGDVATIIQDIPELAANGHRHKRIDYDYDQLSGKVNAVFYQKGQAD